MQDNNYQYQQIVDLDKITEVIHQNALRAYSDNEYHNPLIKVGYCAFFDIVVRASWNYWTKDFTYDGGYQVMGSCNRKGGFKSIQAVIDYGIQEVNESLKRWDNE